MARMIWNSLVLLAIFTIMTRGQHTLTPLRNLEFSRGLSTCNFSTCNACNDRSGCAYLNGGCTIDPGTSINSETFDQETDYIYCKNAVASGSIDLTVPDRNSLSMSAGTGASASSHSICEWKIKVDSNTKHFLKVTRSPANYEDIQVYVKASEESKYYTSKSFSDCSSSNHKMSIGKPLSLIVRVKILSDASKYEIVLEEEEYVWRIQTLVIVIVPSVIGSLALLAFFLLLGFCIKSHIKHRRLIARMQVYQEECEQNRDSRIIKTMENMRHGLISHLKTRYKETSCIICLEVFNKSLIADVNSEVHVTNECEHTIHTNCLAEWFNTIAPTKDLTCPTCNTVLSADSNPASHSIHESCADLSVSESEEAKEVPINRSFCSPFPSTVGFANVSQESWRSL